MRRFALRRLLLQRQPQACLQLHSVEQHAATIPARAEREHARPRVLRADPRRVAARAALRAQNGLGDAASFAHFRIVLIQENADPEVRRDLERFFSRLAPDGDELFRHTVEGDDDMPAHVRTALTAVNLSIPIASGSMTLGTWQGIYLWEHRTHPHSRHLVLHLFGE